MEIPRVLGALFQKWVKDEIYISYYKPQYHCELGIKNRKSEFVNQNNGLRQILIPTECSICH